MSEPLLPGAERLPEQPGEPQVQARKTSWPDVIGIIGIILGILGIIGNIGNVFYPFGIFVAEGFLSHAAPPGLFQTLLGFMPPVAVVTLTGLVKMALSVLLLIGSIHLRNRRRSGVNLLRLWAIIRIPWIALEMGLAFVIVRTVLPNLPHIRAYSVSTEMAVAFGMMLGMLIAMSIPIFILIWFSCAPIRSETETWVR